LSPTLFRGPDYLVVHEDWDFRPPVMADFTITISRLEQHVLATRHENSLLKSKLGATSSGYDEWTIRRSCF
jgi:hypothetical protein